MATTPFQINAAVDTASVKLTALAGATGTPAASYATTTVIAGLLYSASATEALVGLFQYHAYDAADTLTGYGTIELADDTVVHHPGDTPSKVTTAAAQATTAATEIAKVPRAGAGGFVHTRTARTSTSNTVEVTAE